MNHYEYTSIKTDVWRLSDAELLAQLNRMGHEGWNLIAAVPHERHGYSHEVHLLFSRQSTVSAQQELCAPAE
jgi:hypothetical protein